MINSIGQPIKKIIVISLVTVLIGISAGIGGMFLVLLLHSIQHIAFGYSLDQIISNESFLEGVRSSSPLRRVLILSLCGIIASLGWWSLFKYAQPLVSISAALKKIPPKMPAFTTISNALLQIVTVALGSPLGREVAPREIGALFACWLADITNLSNQERKIMVACGAGAGLAAVYNVPLSGALFVLEVLLRSIRLPALIPAFVTSALAVIISWGGLGNEQLYSIEPFQLSAGLIIFSILTGPILGIAAFGFSLLTTSSRKSASKSGLLPFYCLLNFIFIGFLAIYFPELLGNGKSPVQLEFLHTTAIQFTFILLALRIIIVYTSLRVGAQGGLLTPSLANGALLAVIFGIIWNLMWINIPLNAVALIGATAFLAAAQKMPITAITFIFELTGLSTGSCLPPVLFAVTGAMCSSGLCNFIMSANRARK